MKENTMKKKIVAVVSQQQQQHHHLNKMKTENILVYKASKEENLYKFYNVIPKSTEVLKRELELIILLEKIRKH